MVSEEIWLDDLMGRKASSDFLTSYMLANPHIKVLNVNSPWGAGKSFFLKRWAKELSQKHICVTFNAWETDYTDEPLVALITCIEEQTSDQRILVEAGKATVGAGTSLIKKATPLIIKGLIKRYVGVELDEIIGDSAGEAAEGIVEQLIAEQSKTPQHVAEFKKAMTNRIAEAQARENKESPAFIFIDELDRCRPTYAIELLERIKHFFEIENCRFVVASDSSQLAHSIRAIYGERFHSERYLNRFFDAEFRLDNRDTFVIAGMLIFESKYSRLGVNIRGEPDRFRREDFSYPDQYTLTCEIQGYTEEAMITVALARYFNLELRDIVRGTKQLKSMRDALPEHYFHYFWAALLVFAKLGDEKLYTLLTSTKDTATKLGDHLSTYSEIKFSLAGSNIGISQIAQFYFTSLNKTKREVMATDTAKLAKWQRQPQNGLEQSFDVVIEYRNIVELAHRLA